MAVISKGRKQYRALPTWPLLFLWHPPGTRYIFSRAESLRQPIEKNEQDKLLSTGSPTAWCRIYLLHAVHTILNVCTVTSFLAGRKERPKTWSSKGIVLPGTWVKRKGAEKSRTLCHSEHSKTEVFLLSYNTRSARRETAVWCTLLRGTIVNSTKYC